MPEGTPLTSDNFVGALLAAFQANGITTVENLNGFVAYAGKYVQRQNLSYALDAAKLAAASQVGEANAAVAAAQQALNAFDAQIAAGH